MYVGGLNRRGGLLALTGPVGSLLEAFRSKVESVRVRQTRAGAEVDVSGQFPFDWDLRATVGNSEPSLDLEMDLHCLNAFASKWSGSRSFCGRLTTSHFEHGQFVGEQVHSQADAADGVTFTIELDRELFPPDCLPTFHMLCGCAAEWAALNAGLRVRVESVTGDRRDYCYPAGLLSLAEEEAFRSFWDARLPGVWHGKLVDGEEWAEVAIVHHVPDNICITSFANGLRTVGNGTHVDGVLSGLKSVAAGENADRDRFGMSLYVAVRLNQLHYAHSSRDQLIGERPFELCRRLMVEQYRERS